MSSYETPGTDREQRPFLKQAKCLTLEDSQGGPSYEKHGDTGRERLAVGVGTRRRVGSW